MHAQNNRLVILLSLLIATSLCSIGTVEADSAVPPEFVEIGCKGVYDAEAFNSLTEICQQCYKSLRGSDGQFVPEVLRKCLSDGETQCFTSNYFKGCVDFLYLVDELPKIKERIAKVHGGTVDLKAWN